MSITNFQLRITQKVIFLDTAKLSAELVKDLLATDKYDMFS